jgi:hypothetical protein
VADFDWQGLSPGETLIRAALGDLWTDDRAKASRELVRLLDYMRELETESEAMEHLEDAATLLRRCEANNRERGGWSPQDSSVIMDEIFRWYDRDQERRKGGENG